MATCGGPGGAIRFGLVIWLVTSWTCTVRGQPVGSKRSLPSSSTPETAWQAFNTHLKSDLPKQAVAAFKRVFRPKASDYSEHMLNDLTAKQVQKTMAAILEDEYSVDISIYVWDSDLPEGYAKILTSNRVGVMTYDKCLYPPADVFDDAGGVIMQPCREGGAVLATPVSTAFSTQDRNNQDRSKRVRKENLFQVGKRVMLFFTPHEAWSLVSFPDYKGAEGPTYGTLTSHFSKAMVECESREMPAGVSTINLSIYAQCIVNFFERHPMKYQTALRGVAIVPEVLAKFPMYSAPGFRIPIGNVFMFPIPLPPKMRQASEDAVTLWIVANGPVMVLT